MDVSSPCGDMVRFAGEKGSCDLFPTLVQICSIAKGKKVGLGVFLAHGFRDGQYISEHRDIYVPIYLNSYISEYLCIRTHLNTYISEYRDVYVSVYLNSYISKYLYIHVSEHLHI